MKISSDQAHVPDEPQVQSIKDREDQKPVETALRRHLRIDTPSLAESGGPCNANLPRGCARARHSVEKGIPNRTPLNLKMFNLRFGLRFNFEEGNHAPKFWSGRSVFYAAQPLDSR
jgi:hypothetical protein